MNKPVKMNIFILPNKNKNNKYIELIKSSIKNCGVDANLVDLKKDSLFYILSLIIFKKVPKAKNIIHIQWSTVLYGSRSYLKSFSSLIFNTAILLVVKKFFGVKIAWTVHNFYAHDYPHPSIDRTGRKILRRVADLIIVHQRLTFADYSAEYPEKNINYIPHGNYIGAYGPLAVRDSNLRRSLNFADGDIVLISLGIIAPYKANEKIIEAVISARKKIPRLKLLIIGKGKEEYVRKLQSMTLKDGGVVIKNSFVPDAEIPKYFSISDYSIFYYDGSEMTSGGLILSLSYGVSAISRAIPGAEIIGENAGLVFSDEIGLIKSLEKISDGFEKKSADDIIDTVRGFDWVNIAQDLIRAYGRI